MYRSLYSALDKIIRSKSTGILNILHYSTSSGAIYFSRGVMVRIVTGDLEDIQAANKIFSWVSYLIKFEEQKVDIKANPKNAAQTEKVMAHLGKINKVVDRITKNLGGNEAIVEFHKLAANSDASFSDNDLKVSAVMDKPKRIRRILLNSKLSELTTLMVISRFLDNGFARLKRPHAPLPLSKIKHCFGKLTDILSEVMGPVAEVFVDEACLGMNLERNEFCESDFRLLLYSIMEKLDEDELKTIIDICK